MEFRARNQRIHSNQSELIQPLRTRWDRRSGRIETYSEVILGLVTETPDMTLAELRTKLKERRVSAGIGTLWRFFKRRRITLKKRRRMRLSSNAAM